MNSINTNNDPVPHMIHKDFEMSLMYHKSTSIWHFEQYNQQLSNLICQNCDGSIKILLDVGNQQHAV